MKTITKKQQTDDSFSPFRFHSASAFVLLFPPCKQCREAGLQSVQSGLAAPCLPPGVLLTGHSSPSSVPTEPLTQGPPSEVHCSSPCPHERRLPQPSCPTTGPSPQAAAPAQGAPAGVHLRAVPPSGLILVHCRLLHGASGDLPCAVPTGCREIDLHRSQLSASFFLYFYEVR